MSAASPRRAPVNAYCEPVDQVLAALETDARRGLGRAEARARLERYGPNELTAERPVPGWRKFLEQFRDVLVVLLLVATAISAGLWLYERDSAWPYEATAILAVVLLNAVMGYVQQSRAEQAVAALRRMSAAHATVVREGARQRILATEVVPGDILLVEEGDTIPADARLVQEAALQAAEAALTGESLPVSKDTLTIGEEVGLGDRHSMIFSGTVATYGRGRAVVVATGMQTEMGRIAGMLKEAPTETTPLQKELALVGHRLAVIVVVPRRRDHGGRDPAGPRREPARRPDRGLGEHTVRADHGLHDAAVLLALHRLQRAIRRGERVRRDVLQPLVVGRGPPRSRCRSPWSTCRFSSTRSRR